jgi:hypothetical protein
VSTNEQQSKLGTDEEDILKALAEDYTVNPGLYMTREDLKERLTEEDDAELMEFCRSFPQRISSDSTATERGQYRSSRQSTKA